MELTVPAYSSEVSLHLARDLGPSLLESITERVPLEACIPVADRLIAATAPGPLSCQS